MNRVCEILAACVVIGCFSAAHAQTSSNPDYDAAEAKLNACLEKHVDKGKMEAMKAGLAKEHKARVERVRTLCKTKKFDEARAEITSALPFANDPALAKARAACEAEANAVRKITMAIAAKQSKSSVVTNLDNVDMKTYCTQYYQ